MGATFLDIPQVKRGRSLRFFAPRLTNPAPMSGPILAERFAVHMKELRDIAFTESKNKIQLTGGNFVTYCELHPGRCAFLVHVPSYRNFDENAKTTLAEIAWSVAQETVAESMMPGDRLAVGLKGTLLYGAVMTGTVFSDESKPAQQSTEKELLAPFFERSAEKEAEDVIDR
jgi:hypothetical protein